MHKIPENNTKGLVFGRTITQLTLRTKIPKSMSVFMIFLDICMGINFGFRKVLNQNIQSIGKFFSITIFFFVILILLLPIFASFQNPVLIIIAIQYAFNIIILNFSQYNFYEFVNSLSRVDNDVLDVNNWILGVVALGYTLLMFFAKYSLGLIYCSYLSGDFWCNSQGMIPYFIYAPISLFPDAVSVIFTLIYYYIYSYVKQLKKLINVSDMTIKRVQIYYLGIADCYDQIMPLYDKLMTTELFFEIPKLMGIVLSLLRCIQARTGWFAYALEFTLALHIIIRIIVPSIITEMVKSEVESIKLTLHNQLLSGTDEKKYLRVRRMMRYMEVRRLEHKVWRVIPIDLQLPLTVLSMCVTYLIVIIQFTHLYD